MPEVFGRETELAELRRFIARVPEGPCALTLLGEAGIGKSALWDAGLGFAREHDLRLLTCRSARSEAELSYAGLCDVLEEVPEEALTCLPEVQRHALEVALLRAEPGASPIDHRTLAAATLGALRWCASTGPVLIALDDPQWMDEASRSTLAYAIRRLDEEPVGVLAAVRVGEGEGDDPLELTRGLSDERLQGIEVGPLSAQSLGRMLSQRVGWVPEGSAMFELHTVTGGNPLFALEIARAMLLDPDHGFLVPRSLQEQVARRIAALPEETREALIVAAALPRPTVGMIDEAMGRGGHALGPAVGAGMVEMRGDAVRFTHPLYGSAAYADAREEDRARIHRRLAELVTDREEGARHLALAAVPPDALVGDVLEKAAERARARGAPRAAADLALEARRFTPEDRARDGRRRVLLAADELFEAGEIPHVVALLEDVLEGCPKGPERGHVLWRLGRAGSWGESGPLDMGESWLEQAEAEAGADPWAGSLIHRYHFWFARQRYRYAVAAEHARPALELAGSSGDPAARAASLALLAWAEMVSGRGVADEVIREALRTWEAAARTPSGSAIALEEHPGLLCGEVLCFADRLDQARGVLEAVRQEASDLGSEAALSIALIWLFEVELLGGDWDLVSRHVEEASRLQVNANANLVRLMKGTIAAHVGHADEARRDLMRGLEVADSKGVINSQVEFINRLGFLELSLGNLAEAHRHLSQATALFMEAEILDPGFGWGLPDAIETLVGLGELAEAERLTDWLEERGRALDRASALATGARCRGLLLAAKGDYEAALEHLERAVREHERLPMPFERGRTLLVLGTVRRHAKQKRAARQALEEALAILERLGAAPWVERARAELSSIAGRPAATGELTPTEERVARLAAAGRTNREIGETLYLSVRTIETHLSHAYRKLGVRSRTELALVLEPPPTT